jgi:hypothetical protein
VRKRLNPNTSEAGVKISRRFATLLLAGVSVFAATAILASNAAAQNGGWMVVRAEYGFRAQHTDVSGIVKDLVSRGGMNGFIAVNNQMMGGDPAPGADKTLKIFARNGQGQDQEFDYREGAFVPANMFFVERADGDPGEHAEGDDHPDDGDHFAGGRDHDDWNRVSIEQAFWGAQGRMVPVTDVLQHMLRNGALTVVANNASLGIDPAPGAGKILIVVYSVHGKEQAAAASEGHMLTLP